MPGNTGNEINFLNDDPGAVRYGNFINYYKFHPVEQRMRLFPTNIWENDTNDEAYVCLDIGCNAGDLTIALHKFLREILGNSIKFLGIDVDPTLITRATENCNNDESSFHFECLDIMNNPADEILTSYLQKNNKKQFNVIFCFSVTMWIHLNHGDEGLRQFLEKICKNSEIVVVEPQPWKCYKTAVKRLKRANSSFPFYEKIKKQDKNVETFIEDIIENYNFHKIHETPATEWGRRILFYKRKNS